VADEKEEFRKKLAEVTNPSTLLNRGIPVLKRRVRLAQEKYDKEAEDVENMLQNPAYLTALQQREEAKRELSMATWEYQQALGRLQALGAEVEEDDGTGTFEATPERRS